MRNFREFVLSKLSESVMHVDQMVKLFQNPQSLNDPRFQGNVQTALRYMVQEIGDPSMHQAVANSPEWLEAVMEIMQAMPQLKQNPGLVADATAFERIVHTSPVLMQAAELSVPQATPPVVQPQAPQIPKVASPRRNMVNPWVQPPQQASPVGTGMPTDWPTR